MTCAEILANVLPDEARTLFESNVEEVDVVAKHPVYSSVILSTTALAVASVVIDPRDTRANELGDTVERLIDQVPSLARRAELKAMLASHYFRASVDDRGRALTRAALADWNLVEDKLARQNALAYVGPLIALDDVSELAELVRDLPDAQADEVLSTALLFVMTRRPFEWPIDFEHPRCDVPMPVADRVLDLLELCRNDGTIAWAIAVLTRAVLDATGPSRLNTRQIGRLAARLDELAARKLPAPSGIQHEGYLVYVRALTTLLRTKVGPAGGRADWAPVAAAIDAIPNSADRVILRCWIGDDIGKSDQRSSKAMLEKAAAELDDLPNESDRVGRLDAVASTYVRLGMRDEATKAVKKAFEIAQDLDEDPYATRQVDRLLEKADAIDPELASILTTLVDDKIRRYSLEERTDARAFVRQPSLVGSIRRHPLRLAREVGEASVEMQKGLSGGRVDTQRTTVMTAWLRAAAAGDYNDIARTVSWAIENAAARSSKAERMDVAKAAILSAELAWRLGQSLAATGGGPQLPPELNPVPQHLTIVRVGETEQARALIREWVEQNARTSLLLVDQYFTIQVLNFLRDVPQGVALTIATRLKDQRGLENQKNPPLEEMQSIYERAWESLSAQDPPPTQILMLGTRSGESPLHDRYLITEERGLRLSTSLNGFGVSQSEISDLDASQAGEVRTR